MLCTTCIMYILYLKSTILTYYYLCFIPVFTRINNDSLVYVYITRNCPQSYNGLSSYLRYFSLSLSSLCSSVRILLASGERGRRVNSKDSNISMVFCTYLVLKSAIYLQVIKRSTLRHNTHFAKYCMQIIYVGIA